MICSLGDGKPLQRAKKRENLTTLWRFEDNTCSVILLLFFKYFFLVYLIGTLGV